MEDSSEKITSENLLNREIIFQGQKMFFGEVLQSDSSALEVSLSELSMLEEIGKAPEFDELRIHIDRKFLQSNAEKVNETESTELRSDKLLEFVEGKKVVVLSDERGKGKTTELRLLTKLLKLKYPKHWVALADLKDLIIDFDDKSQFETSTDITQLFCNEVLKISHGEAAVFMNLFINGNVIILMDGFDEISLSVRQFVLKLTNAIKEKSGNQVWIATRPQTQEDLRDKLNGEIFKLKPLAHQDLEIFVEALLMNDGNVTDNHEKKTEEASRFLFGLNSYRSNKIEEPIIFRLLMEVFAENCSTKLDQTNYFSLFKRFVDIMIEKFLSIGKNNEVISINIFAFHQKYALMSIFGDQMKESNEMIEKHFASFKLPQIRQMTSVGFVSSNGSKEIQFLDLTLAEFFAADFFYKNLFLRDDQEDGNIVKLFTALWAENKSYSCRMVTIFLDSVFETSTAPELEKYQTRFVRMLSEKDLQEVFRLAAFDGCLNMIQIISLIFKDREETLFEMWSMRRFGTNALMMAVESQRLENIDRMMKIAHEVLPPRHFKGLFISQSSIGMPNLYFAASSSFAEGAAAFIVNHRLNPLTDEESRQLLTVNIHDSNILLTSCEMTTDLRGLKNNFQVVKDKCSAAELKTMFSEGKLLFIALPSIQKPETFVWLSERFKEIFTIDEIKDIFRNVHNSDDDKFSLIHVASRWTGLVFKAFFIFLEEVFREKSEQKQFLALDFHNGVTSGVTMFHYVTENADDEAFLLIKSKYEALFTIEEMKEMILSPQLNIFAIAIQGYNNVRTIAALWSYMQELLDVETLKQVLLKREIEMNQKWHETFWQSEKRFNDVVAIFDPFVNEHLTAEEAKSFREMPAPEKRFDPNARFWS